MKHIKNTFYFLFGVLMFGVFLIDRVIQVPLWWLKSENFDAFMSNKKIQEMKYDGTKQESSVRKQAFVRIVATFIGICIFQFLRFLWNLVF